MRLIIISLLSFILLAQHAVHPPAYNPGMDSTIRYFSVESKLFAQSCTRLQSAIRGMHRDDRKSIDLAISRLKEARMQYKKIESLLEYFFPGPAFVYNGPPTYEMEEPYMEFQKPIGFQVMESLLFQRMTSSDQIQLEQQSEVLASSARDLPSLVFGFHPSEAELLESLQLELVRVMSLGITGYDAPELKTGMIESEKALESIQVLLKPYLENPLVPTTHIDSLLNGAKRYLLENREFNHFNRLYFIREIAIPLQSALASLMRSLQVTLPAEGNLNACADNLFSSDALLMGLSPEQQKDSREMILLGQRLFNNKSLSSTGRYSCSSCHMREKMFTDQLRVSIALDGHSLLSRNAPTLLYSGYQHNLFWDGRANSLEMQISKVLQDPREMGIQLVKINEELFKDSVYHKLYVKSNPDTGNQRTGNMSLIVHALAAYVKTLHPMNSAFDQYIRGDDRALRAEQIEGFNLFMGKARCGTCHFIPFFNGLIPPEYKKSAFEVLGTPETGDVQKPMLDTDLGRYLVYPLSFNKRSFKTPTLRNIAKTPPYMHNGCFHSLQQVLDFYNKGGGAGLGLTVSNQTLSTKPLHLREAEIKDIILFMDALTDSL